MNLHRLALVAAAVAALSTAAIASASPPATDTFVFDNSLVVPLDSTPPCLGTATITFHDVFHVTDFGDGSFHIADNQSGTFVFESTTDGRTYTGRYSGTFNVQSPPVPGFTIGGTFQLVGTADDGARLRFTITFHENFTPQGSAASVDEIRCSLG